MKGLHGYRLFYTSPCCFSSLVIKQLSILLSNFVGPCYCRRLSDETNPSLLPSVYTLSGAIDLAAKSAGIIPGSPSRDLTSPSVDNKMLLSSTPVTEAEQDTELLQHNIPEVSSTCMHAPV